MIKDNLKKMKNIMFSDTKKAKQQPKEPLIVDDVEMDIVETDKNKVWAFCAGQYSNDFRGNPKWLFVYINKYRKDISAYWLCSDEDVIQQIRSLGYRAYHQDTLQAQKAIDHTGVLVAEYVKAVIPKGLENVKYLNLWHGVGGVKAVERALTEGVLAEELAKKYIKNNSFYRMNELYLAPSKFIEDIASEQLGLEKHQIIKAGYPRCIYQKKCERIATFDHDLITQKGLPNDTRIVVYAPTYRNFQGEELFSKAIPDIEKLISVCEKEHILMIFKMHPLLENELGFIHASETYKNSPWLWFWDNKDDFYEILDQIDLCIMDYSSIFTDILAAGVKHFLRYTFDFENQDLNFPMDYDEVTLGRRCENFEDLLYALQHYEEDDLSESIDRIKQLYWEYDDDNSFDRIIDATLAFKPEKKEFPTLYSFDIFDTLISRKVLVPEGIFYYVKEKMQKSDLNYPKYLVDHYPVIRKNAELNMREYYNRSKTERDDERCEIQFVQIFDRIKGLYDLNEKQVSMLQNWEMEAELENVIPIPEQIEEVKQLLKKNETVLLISDMYLPKEFITKMLHRADPILTTLPLYLSSDIGYQKSAKSLYLEVYRSFAPNYIFGKWIHTGDNVISDQKRARALNIQTKLVNSISFNEYEQVLVDEIGTYDSYLIAASMARFRHTHPTMRAQFAFSYISLLFVPYVRWAMKSAKSSGDEIVYFVSRDGHHLKRIADMINEKEEMGLDTKYIYASRRAWRIPSFFDHIDVGFWSQGYGNFAKVNSFSKLLKALDMTEEKFREIFPELRDINYETVIEQTEIVQLTNIFKNSEKYEEYLLEKAAEERESVCGYLEQEIDKTKQFSIVEYWGRGYTQENFTRLWQSIVGEKVPVTFYYSRSTLPSDECNIRKNYTTHPASQSFIESIFANINYKSIEKYNNIEGKWIPEIEPIECDFELFYDMEKYLPEFAKVFCEIPALDRDSLGRSLIDFAISYYTNNQESDFFTDILSKLVDSVELYGKKREYAKALTMDDLDEISEGQKIGQITKSITMSVKRAPHNVQQRFMDMFQIYPGEKLIRRKKLNSDNIDKSKQYQQEIDSFKMNRYNMNDYYLEFVNKYKVKNQILLLTDVNEFSDTEYGSLLNILNEQDKFEVVKIALKRDKISDKELAKQFAISKFILMPRPISKLSGIKLRTETKSIILGDTAVQYFLNGKAKQYTIRSHEELDMLKLDVDISTLQLPSKNLIPFYQKSHNINGMTEFLVNGFVRTDIYFNEQYKQMILNRLYKLFPEAKGKKIITYIPALRYRNFKCSYAQMIDVSLLQKMLGDEYVVIIHTPNGIEKVNNQYEVKGFSKDLTKEIPIRAQMLIADVIVADYRDTTFEAPLIGCPIFLSSWDMDEMNIKKNVFCDYENLLFGVPVNNTQDLAERILDINSYDYTNMNTFKEKYLTFCDGNSAERLYEYMCNSIGD